MFNESARELEKDSKYLKGLTKNIDKIILKEICSYNNTTKKWEIVSDAGTDENKKITKMLNAILKYESITQSSTYSENSKGKNKTYENVKEQYLSMLNDNGIKMYQYYEYSQFTKAKFKCTSLKYDDTTGKVNELTFEFTGEIE